MFSLFIKSTVSEVAIGFVKNEYYKEATAKVEFVNESILFYYPCITSSNCTAYHVTLSPGKYLLETWGASGGDCNANQGGKGGYSSGEITIGRRTHFYINIGGKGQFYDAKGIQPGGFNGGGNGWRSAYYGAGGGGATDIRINGNSLLNRVIVSGGGGGASRHFPGGNGGGLNGENGTYHPHDFNNYRCLITGGTQSTAGISQSKDASNNIDGKYTNAADFGIGGSFFKSDNSGWASGGGGGGWFGGARGCVYSSSGSGGSGYVFTNESYKKDKYKLSSLYQLENITLITGNSNEIPDDIWSFRHPNYGNGAVRITLSNSPNQLLWRYLTCFCKKRNYIMQVTVFIFVIYHMK